MSSRISQLHQRWREPAMSVLLLVQCVTVFGLIPASACMPILPATLLGLLPLMFATFVIFFAHEEWAVIIGSIALALSGVVAILACFQQYLSAVIAEDGVAIVTFVLLTIATFVTVFAPGPFSRHRALGAIVLYINIGLVFTLIFRLFAVVSPKSFSGLSPTGNSPALRAALEYFSFSTLTSVGFGDITAMSPVARSFAVLEAMIGQLFPATLLARAVTRAMHMRGE